MDAAKREQYHDTETPKHGVSPRAGCNLLADSREQIDRGTANGEVWQTVQNTIVRVCNPNRVKLVDGIEREIRRH
jgi:hypothetical protein